MRKHYIDNLRWATVLIVIIYHVFYLFNTCGVPSPVGKDAGYPGADVFCYIVYPWFMVLLFLVAGMSARWALQKRTHKEFLHSKVIKLLVPSTLGLFVFQWITGLLNVKIFAGDTISKTPGFILYPICCVSGIGPLWFIQMLFVFSLLLVLVRLIDKNDKFYNLCGKSNLLVAILLVLPIWGFSYILNVPVISTYRFGIYGFAYFAGYFVFSHDNIGEALEKAKYPLLAAAVALCVAFNVVFFRQNFTCDAVLTNPLTNAYLWAAILAILGCSKAWFNKTSKFADYMTKSSFGFYIVHYLVILALCYGLYKYTAIPHILNYVIAIVAGLPLTFLLYELLKRIPIIRFLVLGIKKPKKSPSKEKETAKV